MTHNIIDSYGQIHRQMPSYCLYTNSAWECHVVKNVLRKPVLSGPLESDIGKVWDMSEIATENKVYYEMSKVFILFVTERRLFV